MLNKEECEKALDSLRVFSLQNLNANLREVTKSNDVIEQLIKKHFDNQPLKFEELHEDEPLWDKTYNMWRFVQQIDFDTHSFYDCTCDEWIDFEENRFYRKQVEDDESI